MKIKGLKKAVGDFKRANKGGYYSPRYGQLMFDEETGEIWVDEFYCIGHNWWKEYDSEKIVNLGSMMYEHGVEITMANIKDFIQKNFGGYE